MPTNIEIQISAGSPPPIEVTLNYATAPEVTIELSEPITETIEISFANIGPQGLPGIDAPTVSISAGASSQTIGNLIFSNSNGISFGLSNGSITASVDPTGAASSVVFSNSNNVSFGLNGSTLTASASYPAQTQYVFSNSNSITFGTNGSTVTASFNQSSAVFSNSNNVSFGLNGSTITASASFPSATSLVFSNSNGVTFGTNGSTLTASVATNYQSQGNYLTTAMQSDAATISNINVSAGTTSRNLSNFVFSNGSGVSFGLNGSTITATVQTNYLTTAMQSNAATISNVNLSAGTTSNNLSAFVLSNSNGMSFGLNGSTITASYTVPSQVAFGISAGTQSVSTGTLVFSNSNGISFGMSGSSRITASYTVPTLTNSSLSVSAGNGSSLGSLSQLVFSNANSLSFGLSTSNNGSATLTGSFNYTVPTLTNSSLTMAAGGSTLSSVSQVVFSNANGVSFLASTSNNGSITISASVVTTYLTSQSNQNVTAGNGGFAFQTLSFSNVNGLSFGTSAGSAITASYTVPSTAGLISAINVSGGTTSNNLSAITFSNANGVSFGLNGSVMTGSVATNYQSQGAYLTTAALSSQTLAFSLSGNSATTNSSQILNGGYALAGGNGVTLQQSNNTISFSVATNYQSQGAYLTTAMQSNAATISNVNLSAGTTSNNLSAFVFSNANGVSFGLNGSTVTGSVAAAGGAQTAISGMALSNTTYTSGTVSFRDGNGISWASTTGQGISLTHGLAFTSNDSLSLATSQATSFMQNWQLLGANTSGTTSSAQGSILYLSGGNNMTLSGNSNTIIFSAGIPTMSFLNTPVGTLNTIRSLPIGSLFIQPLTIFQNLSASVADVFCSVVLTTSGTSNTSYSGSFTMSAALYSMNAGTLSLASSGSQSYSYSYTSNVSTSNLSNIRRFTIPINVNASPGNYWYAYNFSFAAGSGSISLAIFGGAHSMSNISGLWGAANTISVEAFPYGGVYSTTTGAFPSNIANSQIYGGLNGATLSANLPIYMAFRNISML